MSIFISTLRALYRFLGFTTYTFFWIIGFYIVRHSAKDAFTKGIYWRRKWHNLILPMCGIEVTLSGQMIHLSSAPVIFVANHRTYIDPVVITRYAESVVISKSEVADWPLIGKGISITGVVFVKRDDKQSRSNTLVAMESLLQQGASILVFPEGTTTAAPGFLSFRPRTFELASRLNIPVVPIAIEYENPDDAWIGDDTFLRHFFQTFGRRKVKMHITLGPPMKHEDGIELMNMAHDWIAKELTSLNLWVQRRS